MKERTVFNLSPHTRAIVEVAVPVLVKKMQQHDDFRVFIVGYSLGAGIAQLLSLELHQGESRNLLPHSNITTIGFGSPPVFTSRQRIPTLNNLLLVKNANDFMTGVSLRTITDLMDRIAAIKSLNLRRRVLFKMALDNHYEEDGFIWSKYESNKKRIIQK